MEEALPEVTIETKGSELSQDRASQAAPDAAEQRQQKIQLAQRCIARFKRWVQTGRGLTFTFALPDDVGEAMVRKYADRMTRRDYAMTFENGVLSISAIKNE